MTADEARTQQTAMRKLVSLTDSLEEIKTVAGVDLSLNDDKNEGHAIVVVLSFPDFRVLETCYATAPLRMPYVSGLLSFRESPIALEAFAQLETVPDLILVDGQGQAHPRGFGIACHLGVLLDVPAIGVAKSRLYGQFDSEALGEAAGGNVPLWDRSHKQVIGSVLRTKVRTNPLFVSPGHRVSVESATRVVQECLRGYRLPEPTRQAHALITAYKTKGVEATASTPSPSIPSQETLPF